MSKPDSAWSQQRISEFLAFEELGYQKIELPYGLATPGVERRYLYDIAFGNQLSGESVLDVGSYLGAFCIESLKRGAGAAVGLELNRERIRQARAIAEILALKPEYRQLDIETCSLDGTFDITLCLNVLHHLRDPVRVLYELTEVTKRKLVLEFAAFGRRDRRKNKVGRISARVFARHPSIYVASGNPDKRNQTFFFSPHAVARLLDGHKKQYHTVTVMKSEDFKERCVIVAEKLRIRKLTVVSGPTSSGKSTLMESLMGGGKGDLALSQLVMRDPH
ncbi:MAG: methyltransferase domain-containing protein, partial [Nitrosospira sp.]|nr:methyltransferase domain-containing protein [Nitrosospira sp.]